MTSGKRRFVAWDTETACFAPGYMAPALTCVSICDEADASTGVHPSEWPARLLDHVDGLEWFRDALVDDSIVLVGHNLAFDVGVMLQEDPSLYNVVVAAYEADRFTDTMLRQQLFDIANGEFRGRFGSGGKWLSYEYHLADLTRRHLGWTLEKDEWRMRYGELRGVPIKSWEPGRQEYPKHDARGTLAVCLVQQEYVTDPEAIEALDSASWLQDEFRQARRFMGLRGQEAWGLRTDAAKVDAFAVEAFASVDKLKEGLVELGLVRPNGSRNTKAAARLMVEVCDAKGIGVTPTKGAIALAKKGEPIPEGKGVCLDADACKRADDWRLEMYADYVTAGHTLSTDLPMLRRGCVMPVHTHFGLAWTNRNTSASPNFQNLAKHGGVRECFVPRRGWVFAQGDFPNGELHTLAQWCLNRFGYSRLAEVLNSGLDPHVTFGARMMGITYEEMQARRKAGDPEAKKFRQMAKPFNFGKPGGMGTENFIQFARGKAYQVKLTYEEAEHYGRLWLDEFPEMADHFRYSSNMARSSRPLTYDRSPGIRGDYTYTSASNDGFQRLLADIMSDVVWALFVACYQDKRSPLYGSRVVNSIHDEVITETWDDSEWSTRGERASAAALEQVRIMREIGNRWVPDVPFEAIEPVLMSYWSKDAESIVDERGIVRVWRGEGAT